jgi:MFS family permease
MGLLGSTSAVGTALGPSLGGVLTAWAGWRAIFLVNIPLGLTAVHLVHRHLPADPRRPGGARRRLSPVGTLLMAVTLAAYALAMTTGDGRPGALAAALLLVAAGAGGLLVLAERRSDVPLVGWSALRDPGVRGGLLASGVVSTVMMATLVVGPFHLARGLGLDATAVGLAMSVGPAVVVLAGIPAGRITDRLGAGRVTVAGLVSMAGGTLLLSLMPMSAGVPGYVGPIVVVTLGYALFQTANNAAVMAGAPPDLRGVTSGMLNLSRNLGLITGASLLGAVFALAAGTSAVASAPPEDVATGMRATFAVAVVLLVGAIVAARGAARADGSARDS